VWVLLKGVKRMKVTVIGGGSTYTPELVNGFLERSASLPVTDLWLMDTAADRLNIVGSFVQRMVAAARNPFAVHLTTNRREALTGAAYVITQLRVGGMAARREDEYLGQRYGLIGQETTGVGGMAKALRTIPVILGIADEMRASSPGALLVNFTNPAGLVTEALARYAPEIPSVGVCNVAITTKMHLLEHLPIAGEPVSPDDAQLDTLGLNHLSWHRDLTIDGESVWPQIMERYVRQAQANGAEAEWDADTLVSLQMIPNYYLQYYYYTARKLAQQAQWPPSRAEQVSDIDDALLRQYADPARAQPPEDLMKRGGAYYSTVATQLLNAHYNDLAETHVVNVPHRGAVHGYPNDWVLEMPCIIRRSGIEPIPAQPLPRVVNGLLYQVKAFELLTVEAAVHGDRDAAYQALLAHPLGPPANKIKTLLEEMLEINRRYLPQFR
jgi:6-phospho-beta-glucosidase